VIPNPEVSLSDVRDLVSDEGLIPG
jgi:hypothetical protein